MNDVFGYKIPPIEGVTPLKEGDAIDLKGLELEVQNFFGHTQDSIALYDKKNRNLFAGDSIIYKWDENTYAPVIMPPDFNESELLKTIRKLKSMEEDLDSLSLAHFGVWKDEDFNKILNEVEDFYFTAKESMIKWYKEDPSIPSLAIKYHNKFIPKSEIHTKENLIGLHLIMEWIEGGLKSSGMV